MKVHPGLKLELVTIYCKQGGCKRPPNSAPHSSGPLRSYMSWRENYNLGRNKMEQPTPSPQIKDEAARRGKTFHWGGGGGLGFPFIYCIYCSVETGRGLGGRAQGMEITLFSLSPTPAFPLFAPAQALENESTGRWLVPIRSP